MQTRSTTASVDLWPELPAELRSALLDRAAAAVGDVHDGIQGSQGHWRPLRPLFTAADHYAELGALSWRLVRLALDACRRRACTVGELQDALGVPDDRAGMVRRSDPLGDDLLVAARPDVVYEAGTPKFLEFNIDGVVGGTRQSDLYAHRFHRLFAGHMPGFALTEAGSAVAARFAAIRSSPGVPDGATVALPTFRHGAVPGLHEADALRGWLDAMCETGRRLGLDPFTCDLDELTADDDGALRVGERRVDVVLRMFQSWEEPDGPGLKALARAVEADRVRLHTSEATWLLSNKVVMAWLWADRERLDEADQALVDRHLPWTVRLSGGGAAPDTVRYAVQHRAGLVLKPGGGYGGDGVTLGRDLSDEDWVAALERAVEAPEPYVIQRFVDPDRVAMEFSHERTGELARELVPLVVGPFLFGGAVSGVYVRHGVPGSGMVLNAHQGARMNSLVLVERAC